MAGGPPGKQVQHRWASEGNWLASHTDALEPLIRAGRSLLAAIDAFLPGWCVIKIGNDETNRELESAMSLNCSSPFRVATSD